MSVTPVKVPRRTLLRGAGGLALGLPLLEAMLPRRARAATAAPRRFIAFFVPNGTSPALWHVAGDGPLAAADLSPCTKDLVGFAQERIWPAEASVLDDVTLVSGIDHEPICGDIHSPAMSLSAHGDAGRPTKTPKKPTLDQHLAAALATDLPYRSLTLANTNDTAIMQGFLSWQDGGKPQEVFRQPARVFDTVFGGGTAAAGPNPELERIRARRQSVLDWARDDAKRLSARLGSADRMRLDQHLQSILEVERQLQPSTGGGAACGVKEKPAASTSLHASAKQMIDLAVLALACDLTRVAVVQYSNSWALNYADYALSDGVGTWSDHFISHRLNEGDVATDLKSLPRDEARRLADARVVQTSRFKVRRFAYLLNALKAARTPTGTLLDESMVLFTSENGTGDSHSRANMPIILAGHAGGFKTGRRVAAKGAPTGALHASILNYMGVGVAQYGDPARPPLPGL
jgi:hypothetical protein